MAQINLTVDSELLKGLFTTNGKDEAFASLVSTILNQVLSAQASEQAGAQPYERSDERRAYRNGYRERVMHTRVGTLLLTVPRLRNGEFSTELFQRYQRSEQALMLAMMEMVVTGVSTRKVQPTPRNCAAVRSPSPRCRRCARRLTRWLRPFGSGRWRNGIPSSFGINEQGYR